MKNVNFKKALAIGTIVTAIGAMSITAFAASVYKTPAEAAAGVTGKTVESVISEKTESDKSYGQIAEESGKLEEFKKEMLEIKKEAIANKVEDGTITQQEGDEWLQRFEERLEDCDGSGNRESCGYVLGNRGQGKGNGNGMGLGRGGRGCF